LFSRVNQARIHSGFHYPRSMLTAVKSMVRNASSVVVAACAISPGSPAETAWDGHFAKADGKVLGDARPSPAVRRLAWERRCPRVLFQPMRTVALPVNIVRQTGTDAATRLRLGRKSGARDPAAFFLMCLLFSYRKIIAKKNPSHHARSRINREVAKMKYFTLSIALVGLAGLAGMAQADKLDDIMSSGKLRCAVVLDFPPMGMRDANNVPIGFDVDYCGDLAAALGVEAEIVETPFPERIPALMSGRVDVGVASTSDTLERAKTVGFSIPYFAFEMAVTANTETGITTFEGMKGFTVGAVAGTYEAIALEAQVDAWGEGSFRPYQTQSDVFLALSQGQLDATVSTSTVAQANAKSGNFPNIVVGGFAPFDTDYVALFARRDEYGLLNYLDLFVNQQIRTGRYAELYEKWIGGEVPSLTVPNAHR
jgi:polar amino acid transport system substrate-binding protein